MNAVAHKHKPKKEGRYACKCECGGEVRGVWQFERLWTWCEKCTPVVHMKLPATGARSSTTQESK